MKQKNYGAQRYQPYAKTGGAKRRYQTAGWTPKMPSNAMNMMNTMAMQMFPPQAQPNFLGGFRGKQMPSLKTQVQHPKGRGQTFFKNRQPAAKGTNRQ